MSSLDRMTMIIDIYAQKGQQNICDRTDYGVRFLLPHLDLLGGVVFIVPQYRPIPTSTLAKLKALSERLNVLRARNVNTLRFVLVFSLTCQVRDIIKCEVLRVSVTFEAPSACVDAAKLHSFPGNQGKEFFGSFPIPVLSVGMGLWVGWLMGTAG